MKCLPKFFTGRNKPGYGAVLFFFTITFFLAVMASLLFGSVPLPLQDLLSAPSNDAIRRILLHVRLPRTLAAALAGVALASSGAIIQSVMGNPLAGPNLIGDRKSVEGVR